MPLGSFYIILYIIHNRGVYALRSIRIRSKFENTENSDQMYGFVHYTQKIRISLVHQQFHNTSHPGAVFHVAFKPFVNNLCPFNRTLTLSLY